MAQAADRATPKAAGKASSKSTPGSTSRSTAGSRASTNGSAPARAAKTTPVTPPPTSARPATGSGLGDQVRGFADRFGLSRLVQPVMRSPGTAGTTGAAGTKKPRSSSFKFLLGMMIFIFSAEFLVYILAFLDNSVFKGALEKTQIGNVPLLGKISPFFIIYILLTLGLWMALYRFNIIPKDPFGVKAQQAAARSGTKGTNSRGTTATVGRNRAARQSASTASSSKETSGSRRTVNGPNDAVYQRVKAAQRSRKRRDAKR